MKKVLALLMCMVMSITMLVGCGSPKTKETSETESSASETTKASETQAAVTPEDLSGTLEVWSSGDELGRFVEGFNKLYPNIKVNITVIPNADYLAKVTSTLSSGQGAPDLFTGESNYVRYLVDSPYWEDLRNDPYNVEQYTSDIWDYIVSVGTDTQGAIKALSWQASPGSIMYRRDIASKYLGTDDPAKIYDMISTNDKMLDVAKKLKENNVKMFASWQDLYNMEFSNRSSGWVVDNKLVIEDSFIDFMDMAKDIVKGGYDLNVDPWSPEWTAAVESEDTFCYVLPTWGYQFVVKPGAVTTIGKWGLAEGPVPYVKGGTWLGMYKDSANKELAWKFLEYVTCNSEAQQAYGREYGEYLSLKSADNALAKEDGEEVLAGQNLYEFFNTQMEKIPNNQMSPYDGTINDAFLSATKAYATDAKSKDDALQQFKDDVANSYPDITVE